MKKYRFYIFTGLLFIITGCSHLAQNSNIVIEINKDLAIQAESPEKSPSPGQTLSPTPSETPKVSPSIEKEKIIIKSYFNLSVPFTTQAPYSNWDDLHNEACEEASMIMADAYFNKKTLNKDISEKSILDFVSWQNQNGYTYDVTSGEVVKILDSYFSLNGILDENVTVENIQKILNDGKLIIIPAAGRRLGNPNFKTPGPLYHMLVIRGYDDNKKEFITNDPGTRNGQEYRYKYDVLINAIHDWPKQGKGKDDVSEQEMESGRKVIIVVSL